MWKGMPGARVLPSAAPWACHDGKAADLLLTFFVCARSRLNARQRATDMRAGLELPCHAQPRVHNQSQVHNASPFLTPMYATPDRELEEVLRCAVQPERAPPPEKPRQGADKAAPGQVKRKALDEVC